MTISNFDPVEPTEPLGSAPPELKDRDSSTSVKAVFIALLVLAVVATLVFVLIAAATNSASPPPTKETTRFNTGKA